MSKFFVTLLILPFALFAQMEETLTIIKPNAVSHKHVGEIINVYENSDFKIKNIKMVHLTKKQAEQFYKEHEGKSFFEDLTTYMTTSPVVVIKLEGEDAVKKNRELIGDTDPRVAGPETLRAKYGQSKARNGVHGSDSVESARREINLFFGESSTF